MVSQNPTASLEEPLSWTRRLRTLPHLDVAGLYSKTLTQFSEADKLLTQALGGINTKFKPPTEDISKQISAATEKLDSYLEKLKWMDD